MVRSTVWEKNRRLPEGAAFASDARMGLSMFPRNWREVLVQGSRDSTSRTKAASLAFSNLTG